MNVQNVRFWLLADITAYVDLCPLSGVKRTLNVTPQNARL